MKEPHRIIKVTLFLTMIDIVRMSTTYAYVLFNLRAIHSFASSKLVRKNGFVLVPLEFELSISTLNGGIIIISTIYKSFTVGIGGHDLFVDLVILNMKDFDIILRID